MSLKLSPIGSNVTELDKGDVTILFSYSTPVAAWDRSIGKYFRTAQSFSRTTTKHINKWLKGKPADFMPQAFFESLTA